MALRLSDILVVPTEQENLDTLTKLFSGRKFPVTAWDSLGVGRIVLQVLSTSIVNIYQRIQDIGKMGILTGNSGDTLTWHANEYYGVERDSAKQTIGYVSLRNSTGSPINVSSGSEVFTDVTGNYIFKSYIAQTIAAGVTANVPIIAQASGPEYNIPYEDLVVTTLSVGLALEASYSGYTWITTFGSSGESDEELITRCQQVSASYQFSSREDFLLSKINASTLAGFSEINRIKLYNPGTGIVWNFLVANKYGEVSSSVINDLEYTFKIRDYLPMAPGIIASSINNTAAVTGTLTVQSEDINLQTQVLEGIESYIRSIPIGDPIRPIDVAKAIQSSDPSNIVLLVNLSVNNVPLSNNTEITQSASSVWVPDLQFTFTVVS